MNRKHRHGLASRVVLYASLLVLTQAACLLLDEDHCLSNGGDLACGGPECIMQTGPTVKTMSNDIGCAFPDYDPHYQLRLPFGLPAQLESSRGGMNDLDSLEGVVAELIDENDLEGVCELDEDIVEHHANLSFVRNRLDSWEYARKEQTKLTQSEIDAVKAYNKTVSAWLDDCRAKASAAGSGA